MPAMGIRHLPGDTLPSPTGYGLLERLALELVTLSALVARVTTASQLDG